MTTSSSPPAASSSVQVLSRAAAVLRAVGAEPGRLRLTDLSERVDLPKTTLHRLLGALADEGLLRVDEGGRIWIGPDLLALGRDADAHLRAQLHPLVVELRDRLDETVDLSVLDPPEARFVDQAQSSQRLRAVSAVGASFPLHCSANGKALLAALPPERRRPLLAGTLQRFTDATTVDAAALDAELDEVQRTGLAYDRGEHTTGIWAVAAAVVGADGPLVALSVPAPHDRFEAHRLDIEAALRETTARAAALLGGTTSA